MELCNIGGFSMYNEETTIALIDSVYKPPDGFKNFNDAGRTFTFEGDESDNWTRVHGCDVLSILTDIASDPLYNFYRILDEYGEYKDRNLVKAIVYAADHGADVVNLSVGSDHMSNEEKDCDTHGAQCAVDEAAEYASEKGVVLVSAAGNSGDESKVGNVCCPALSEHSIAVGGCVVRCTAEETRPPGGIWADQGDGAGLSGTFCGMKGCSSTQNCQSNQLIETWEGNPPFLSGTPDTLAPVY